MGGIYGSTKNAASRTAKWASDLPVQVAKALAPLLNDVLQNQFDNEVGPNGEPQPPLKESTIRRKKGDARILRRTNEMQASTYVLATGGRLVISAGRNAKYAQDGDPGVRVPRLIFSPYGIPRSWVAAMKQAQAIVASRGLS